MSRLGWALAAVVCVGAAAPTAARAGEWTVRASFGYLSPTGSLDLREEASAEFTDPRFPPLGRLDTARRSRLDALSDLGGAIALERRFGGLVGIEASLSLTSLAGETTYSGTVSYTPSLGDPAAAAPDPGRTGWIDGAAVGRTRLLLGTLGASFHLLRGDRIDLRAGPVLGLAVHDSRIESGEFRAILTWVSRTPLADTTSSHTDLALGAAAGLDVPLGARGWLASASARYVWTGGLDPWLVQVGLGYRF